MGQLKHCSLGILFLFIATLGFAGGSSTSESILTVYSGRGESLVESLVQEFQAETGIQVQVRYGGTSELAVLIAEEGARSPADVFWAQDGGALGAMADSGIFAVLPQEIMSRVPELYRGEGNSWVATSGRARVIAYSPLRIPDGVLPGSIFDLTDPRYAGRVGWAPTNASLQAQITAMRVQFGEQKTEEWVRAMISNTTQAYRNNTALIEAIAAGEIDYAITNNYYLLRFLATDPAYPVAQDFFAPGDMGNLVNVAGAGVLKSSSNKGNAIRFINFLLSKNAQEYFTQTVNEYPVVSDVLPNPRLKGFDEILRVSPSIGIGSISDLQGTLELMRRAGAL